MPENVALDNAVWHALRGPLSRFADDQAPVRDDALRFHPDVSIFAAANRLDEEGWAALAELVGPEGSAVLFRDNVPEPPEGWKELYRGPTWQLVAADLAPVPRLDLTPLGPSDADEILALVKETEPGPFGPRTVELGRYVGIRENGELIAMAGERFRLSGWTEVSAVCTLPSARRRGLAGALTLEVARAIRERGDEAFLHVIEENESALRLYLSLGFTIRRKVDVVMVQRGRGEHA